MLTEQLDRITRSIHALLDYARPQVVPVCDLTASRCLDRVSELVGFEVVKRQVGLDVDIPAGLPPIQVATDKVVQILVQLVMNSIEATPAGGRIHISAARVGDDRVVLRVRDTGTGIPTEHLHKLFDPFFTTKALHNGVGLGLTSVDQLVRDHGGRINLTTTMGRGTTVEIVLPVATAP